MLKCLCCEHAKLHSHKLVYILVVLRPSILLPDQLARPNICKDEALCEES